METDDELLTKKCFRILDEPVLDNLNIVYNCSSSKLVLWNKYQIFVYGDTEFECLEKIFIPEFQIHLLIASNNYLLCLDKIGNVHITSLKFKSSSQKTLKIPFQPKDQCIEVCLRHKEDHTLSLKYEADTYFLCFHRINIDFKLEKKVILLCNNEWSLGQHSKEKYLLTSCSISKETFDLLNKSFKSEETFSTDHDLIVLSVDKLNIYAGLFSAKNSNDEIILANLYNCPSEICNLQIHNYGELYLLIGLTMGTIIRLCLKDDSKTPDIVHLNTALYKMLAVTNSLIYSDGTTMWKAENIFTEQIKLTQFFVKNSYDFAKCGDQIICTTFNKLIYKFSTADQNTCLIPKNDEYCAAENLLNNSAYLNKLFEEIDKNNELVMKLEREQHYITALSLSRRPDVVNKAINSTIAVFETYQEASPEECVLTENIQEYFAPDTWMFLISISNSSIYDTLNSIIQHLLPNIIIYITMSTENNILKTTCIKMVEPLKTVHYLIPLNLPNETEINTNIQIVINIPGALDQKKSLIVLYSKHILPASEYFIKTKQNTISSLKTSSESIEELVQKIIESQYGSIFSFTDIKETEVEYTYYVKLPNEYKEIFKSDYCKRLAKIMQQLSEDEFLKSKNHIIFLIGNEKLKVKVHNDGISNPLLQVTGCNAKIALNLRNFFANFIFNEYQNYEPGKEFISYSFYTTTENFQKSVKTFIRRSDVATSEEFLPLMNQFEKNIMGILPL